DIYPRVQRCFEAGALATGTTVSFDEPGPAYSEFDHDPDLVALYLRNATAVGREFVDLGVAGERMVGSTDMANVSLAMPAIHPMLAIESDGAVNHQPAFTAACARPSADKAILDGATAMAWTAIDAAAEGALRDRLLATAYDHTRS
ncbi:MAG: amidohydrolase, partial [Actinobacteria bacterium]|nr:amidohydrolase [Actinomycetota bacterium]